MVTNKKTGKTVKANKMTNDAVKSIKKTRQTLKLEQEAKKQSQKVNKVAKMPTNKIDMSKPSATLPIKEPIATKNDPNKRGNQIKYTSDPPSAATHMKDASMKRNLDEKGVLLNPKKKTDKGAGVESKKKSKCSKEKSGMKSHTTFNIITLDTVTKNKDLNTRDMPEDKCLNFFRWIKTNQPMLVWKVCRKGPPNRQLQQKAINQMKN